MMRTIALLALLLSPAACGGAAGPTPAMLQALAAHAEPATWEDLDPAHPGRRRRDPRSGVVFVRVPATPPFLLAETELTAAQWRRYVNGFAGDPTVPVPADDALPMTASWHDAVAYCERFGYRLPTEQEWEFACRGGLDPAVAPWRGPEELKPHAWFNFNAGDDRRRVGTRESNPFGLYDMLGNVWEWCQEAAGADRVLRGGSWFTMPWPKPELRTQGAPGERNAFYGFRPARGL